MPSSLSNILCVRSLFLQQILYYDVYFCILWFFTMVAVFGTPTHRHSPRPPCPARRVSHSKAVRTPWPELAWRVPSSGYRDRHLLPGQPPATWGGAIAPWLLIQPLRLHIGMRHKRGSMAVQRAQD